ncbi:Uncharacterised protein [Kluyvera cryocrescens]|uniref:Uncharacterized protein n=1 Tax=Kluyvera cryocrescens TaxID=580 RepID=A0A485B0F4_KLUCR|nr:Uncharacterised protein [Kluyvera cryocrescens]
MLCALKKLAVTVDIRENTGRQNVDARHLFPTTLVPFTVASGSVLLV